MADDRHLLSVRMEASITLSVLRGRNLNIRTQSIRNRSIRSTRKRISRFVASSNSVQLGIRERMRARSRPPDIHNSVSIIDRRRSPFSRSTGVLVVRNLYVLSVRKVGRSSYHLISSRRTSLNQAHTEAT